MWRSIFLHVCILDQRNSFNVQLLGSGNSGTCPAPIPRRGNGLCNNDRNVCIDGVCAGSICITMNATDCQCSISAGNPESTLCHVCCRVGSGPCESSFELFDEGQEREAGRSCNNFDGYCSNESPPRSIIPCATCDCWCQCVCV